MRISSAFRRHPVAETISFLLLTFLVMLPKGGIKLGPVPLTWGYLFLGITTLPLLFVRLLVVPLRVRAQQLLAFGSLLPFQILFVFSYLQNGAFEIEYVLSMFVTFFLLPPVFLLLYPGMLHWLDGERFRRYFCFCVLSAALYGILLFFWHPLTGHFIEIPFLTVNAADVGQLEKTKHIARGGFLKLISTYNNGNVYGAATLILLPLYFTLEPRRWKRNVLRVALILTLSRTVWAGLVVEQLLSLAGQLLRTASTFPRLYLRSAARRILAVLLTFGMILLGLMFNSSSLAFLLDPTLGGRAGSIRVITRSTFLPSLPVTGFSEVVYASAVNLFGIAGLLAVLLIFLLPAVLAAADAEIRRDPVRRAAAKGLLLYAIISASDGATILIPVMAFYWFVYMVMLVGLPGQRMELSAAREDTAARALPPHGAAAVPAP